MAEPRLCGKVRWAQNPQNSQSVYSLLGVPYNVLASKQSVPALCNLLRMRLREFSNPPFRTNFAWFGRFVETGDNWTLWLFI